VLPEAVRDHPSVVPSALARRIRTLDQSGWPRAEIRNQLSGVETADRPGAAALSRLDALATYNPPSPPQRRPRWCGQCDQRTRLREDQLRDDRPYRCPRVPSANHRASGLTTLGFMAPATRHISRTMSRQVPRCRPAWGRFGSRVSAATRGRLSPPSPDTSAHAEVRWISHGSIGSPRRVIRTLPYQTHAHFMVGSKDPAAGVLWTPCWPQAERIVAIKGQGPAGRT
jgi:hypothetical protein